MTTQQINTNHPVMQQPNDLVFMTQLKNTVLAHAYTKVLWVPYVTELTIFLSSFQCDVPHNQIGTVY